MVKEITWLTAAHITFDSALTYLEENFTDKEVQKFSERINHKLDLLKSQPRLGKKSTRKNIYQTVIHKRIILIYQYKPLKNEIALMVFWNTLQNPKRLRV